MANIHLCIMFHLVANHKVESYAARDGQDREQLFRALLDETPITADDAARDIMGTHLQFALETLGRLHLSLAEKREAARVSPILLEHVETGAVLLVLDDDQGLVEGNQLVVLVDEHIFIGQAYIAFALKQGILRITRDYIGAVNKFLVTLTTRRIKALQRRCSHSLRETSADKGAVLGNIKANKARHLVASMLTPAGDDFFHRIVGHEVITVDTSVQGRVYVAVGGIVCAMHSLILLINILNRDFALGNPPFHQFPCVVGGAIVNDKPTKIFAGLPAQTLIGAAYRVCTIIGGSENSQCCHVI